MLAGGAEVVPRAGLGFFQSEALRMRRGAGYWQGREHAAGMVLSRAKASTGTLSMAMVAAPLRRRFPCGGIILRHHVPVARGLKVKILSLCGRATAESLASRPPWRRRILRPGSAL